MTVPTEPFLPPQRPAPATASASSFNMAVLRALSLLDKEINIEDVLIAFESWLKMKLPLNRQGQLKEMIKTIMH